MKKKFLITTIILATIFAGFTVLRVQYTGAKAERTEAEILKSLTTEDIDLILGSQGQTATTITQTPETRKLFLTGLREYMALAAQARRDGMTDNETFRINFEHKKNILLGDLYRTKLSTEQGKTFTLTKEQTAEVWQNKENEAKFEKTMETLRSIQIAVAKERGDETNISKLQGGSLEKARENWASAKILSDMAKNDEAFMTKPEVSLRIKILEAGILSADYLRKHWATKVKATPEEITEYLAKHPEYDLKTKILKAESVLKRAKSGEDFAKLASENSEDRTTKNKGGLFENISKDFIWQEVETAALELKNGEIADRLIESNTGFHIVRLENKKISKESDGSEKITFSVRHILFQKHFEDPMNSNPEIPPPFVSADEIAKSVVEAEKRNKLVANIIQSNEINLPEQFAAQENK
jgi:parvulin-like peptidyl-prolyl isomerase